MEPKDLIVYVDVDDTLVRSVGAKRIPIPETVAHVRQLSERGVSLFCWSAGGADYARQTALELGLEACFAAFLPKPHVLIDDHPPSMWPRCMVVAPIALAGRSVEDHLDALAGRG